MLERHRVGCAGLELGNVLACCPLPTAVGQVHCQGAGALVAGIRLLGQGLGQDTTQRLRHAAVDVAGLARLNPGMQLPPVLRVAPGQRQLAEQQLVKDCA